MDNVEPCTQRWLLSRQTEKAPVSAVQLCHLLTQLMPLDAVENFDQPLAADVLCCDLGQQRAERGVSAAIRLLHSVLVDSFDQRQVTVTAVMHQGPHTVTTFQLSGVQHRRLLGIPATQRRVLLAASITSSIAHGQIVRIVLDYDVRELLRQLGMTK